MTPPPWRTVRHKYIRGFVQGGDDTKDKNRHDKPVVSFCISKARVAPVKTETLPRLELTACVLGCRMSKFVTHALAKGDIATFFWTDSKICLGWINQGAQKCKAYVCNRVKEIIECAPARFWQYCPTEKNPADLVTRGISVNMLLNSDVCSYKNKSASYGLNVQLCFIGSRDVCRQCWIQLHSKCEIIKS